MGKQSSCQCRRLRFDPSVKEIPWRRKGQPIPVFVHGEFHGQSEPDRLQSVGSQRVGHDSSDLVHHPSDLILP